MLYEIKSPLGENLKFSLDEIVFQFLSIYNFECDNAEVLNVIQNDKIVFLFNFLELKKEILKYRLKSEQSKIIELIANKMKNLVLFRGTKKEICKKLNTIGIINNCVLYEFEELLAENDFGFNVNLGILGSTYLDYEIYLLKTNEEKVFIVTEINKF